VELFQSKKLVCSNQQSEEKPMESGKIFTNHLLTKGLLSKMYKELTNLIAKNNLIKSMKPE
jgi:hypothetical protein